MESLLQLSKPGKLHSLLFLFLCLCLAACGARRERKPAPKAVKGILDLRGWRFQQDGPVQLKGAWTFYWQQLLTQKQLDQSPPKSTGQLKVPGKWNNYKQQGKRLGAEGYATYHLVVLTTDTLRHPALQIPTLSSAYELDLNGRRIAQSGTIGTSRASETFALHPHLVQFKAPKGRWSFVLRISNHAHRSGGPSNPILLGDATQLRLTKEQEIQLNWFLLGAILIMALYHFGLFALRSADTSTLWFGLLCLAISLRLLLTGERALPGLFPESTFWLWRKAEFLTYYGGFPVFYVFLATLFPQEYAPRITRVFLFISGAFCAVVLLLPARVYTHTLSAYHLVVLSVTAYSFYAQSKALRHKREGSLLLLIGALIGSVFIVNDILYYQKVLHTGKLFPFGMLSFLFCQSFLLSARFSKAFLRVEELSQDLQKKSDLLEEQNQRLQQLDKLKDEFLANTSHELRTPLNGIIGIAESLVDGAAGPLPTAAQDNLRMVTHSGKRLASLIDDLLDFSKLKGQDLQLQQTAVGLHSLAEVTLSLLEPLIGSKELTLHNAIPPTLPLAQADENRLQQILLNLLENAIKFTQEGDVTIDAREDDDRLIITVKDTGIGISEDALEHIFDSFTQANGDIAREYGGSGLGLSISRQLVALHQGTLRVESSLGEGSTFFFDLPIHPAPSPQEAQPSPQEPLDEADVFRRPTMPTPSGSKLTPPPASHVPSSRPTTPLANTQGTDKGEKKTILIVDDEPINLQVLKNHLELNDYHVQRADNGFSALEWVEKSPPDLIVLDLMMPRMSGYEVCRRVRETHEANLLPIIMLTAKGRIDDIVKGLDTGANDYLPKPFNKEELLARIRTHLLLRDLFIAYMELNDELEHKVASRTHELHQALDNARVQKEKVEETLEDLKQAQSQLVQAEKMASLGTLVAGVAHELNNPANYTYNGAHNLRRRLQELKDFIFELATEDAESEVLEIFEEQFTPLFANLESVLSGTERISTIVQDLRTFSRLDEAEQKQVHIVENLESTLSLVKTQFHDRLTFVTEFDDDPQIECWPAQLNQVFMNVIVNACQAILKRHKDDPDAPPGVLRIQTSLHEELLTICFEDNGCGMNTETQSHVFEPFFTTKEIGEGTGLGLSISHGIIEKHHGSISIQSAPQQGTTLCIKLPLHPPAPKETNEQPETTA